MLRASVIITSAVAVIKELVENALDAGATSVQITMDHTTLGSISVADNGSGIAKRDRGLAAAANATSKIRTYDDIETTNTLGFRGEALAAIADIAGGSAGGMTMTTRVAKEQVAVQWRVDRGGRFQAGSLTFVAAPVGTTVKVEGLFARYPVRRRILLAERAQTIRNASQLVLEYALVYPHVRVEFCVRASGGSGRNQSHEIIKVYSGGKTALERLASAFGARAVQHLISGEVIDGAGEDAWKWRYVIPAGEGVKHGREEGEQSKTKPMVNVFAINGRPMRGKHGHAARLMKKINQTLREGRVWVVWVDVPVGWVDVNVEPGKDDIVFRDLEEAEARVGSFLGRAYAQEGGERPRCQKPVVSTKNPIPSPTQVEQGAVRLGGASGEVKAPQERATLSLAAGREARSGMETALIHYSVGCGRGSGVSGAFGSKKRASGGWRKEGFSARMGRQGSDAVQENRKRRSGPFRRELGAKDGGKKTGFGGAGRPDKRNATLDRFMTKRPQKQQEKTGETQGREGEIRARFVGGRLRKYGVTIGNCGEEERVVDTVSNVEQVLGSKFGAFQAIREVVASGDENWACIVYV